MPWGGSTRATIVPEEYLTQPDWQPEGVGLAGNGSSLQFHIPISPDQPHRFFRLDIQRQ